MVGRIDDAGPLAAGEDRTSKRLTLQQLGWVVATELRLYRTPSSWASRPAAPPATRPRTPPPTSTTAGSSSRSRPATDTIRDFKFSPDYHVDEILFRRIIGTVTNAIYVKPQMTYWLDLAERRQVGLSAAFIYSMAHARRSPRRATPCPTASR